MLAAHVVVSLACAPLEYDMKILNQQPLSRRAEHVYVGARLQQHRRVATATDRAVDDHTFGHRREELDHLPSHHREMRELLRHPFLLLDLTPPA